MPSLPSCDRCRSVSSVSSLSSRASVNKENGIKTIDVHAPDAASSGAIHSPTTPLRVPITIPPATPAPTLDPDWPAHSGMDSGSQSTYFTSVTPARSRAKSAAMRAADPSYIFSPPSAQVNIHTPYVPTRSTSARARSKSPATAAAALSGWDTPVGPEPDADHQLDLPPPPPRVVQNGSTFVSFMRRPTSACMDPELSTDGLESRCWTFRNFESADLSPACAAELRTRGRSC
jgi:hypothetical protein